MSQDLRNCSLKCGLNCKITIVVHGARPAREWAVNTGLIAGSGEVINGEPNCMWQDFMTREQMATVLYRFAQLMGKA